MKQFFSVVFFVCLSLYSAEGISAELKASGDIKTARLRKGRDSMTPPSGKIDTKGFVREGPAKGLANTKKAELGLGVDALFAKGWEALGASRPAEALVAFTELVKTKKFLSPGQRSDAYLGWGIALFHEKGCALAEKPLGMATGFLRNKDDALYYLALCDVEARRFAQAKERFEVLLQAQHPRYSEAARFYVAVINEEDAKYEEAQATYQDMIDFSSDKKLVDMAKVKLAAVSFKLAKDRRNKKRLTLAGSLGLGHDSNATLLPQGMAPASVALDAESSFTSLGLFMAEYQVPYSHRFDQTFGYNLMLLHYLSHKIALSSDLHSHEISTRFNWDYSLFSTWSLNLRYNYVFLGEIKSLDAYMATLGSELSWSKGIRGSSGAVTSQLNAGLGVARQESIKGFASTQDPEALNYSLDLEWAYSGIADHSLAPSVYFEYHPAEGSESSYLKPSLGFDWSWSLSPNWLKLKWSNGFEISNSRYYESSTDRVDWLVSGTTSLARTWGGSWETRLQATWMKNYSNVPRSYQYNKRQIMLVATAFF